MQLHPLFIASLVSDAGMWAPDSFPSLERDGFESSAFHEAPASISVALSASSGVANSWKRLLSWWYMTAGFGCNLPISFHYRGDISVRFLHLNPIRYEPACFLPWLVISLPYPGKHVLNLFKGGRIALGFERYQRSHLLGLVSHFIPRPVAYARSLWFSELEEDCPVLLSSTNQACKKAAVSLRCNSPLCRPRCRRPGQGLQTA